MSLTEDSLLHWHIVLCHLHEILTVAVLLCRNAFLPAKTGGTTHRPPVVHICPAVNGAFARDGHILGLARIDEGLEVHAVLTLPSGEHKRIERLVGREEECRSFLQMQVHTALQRQTASVPRTFRHDHRTTASSGTLTDGFVDGFHVGLGFRLGASAIISDEQTLGVVGGELSDAGLHLSVLSVPAIGLCYHWQQPCHDKDDD